MLFVRRNASGCCGVMPRFWRTSALSSPFSSRSLSPNSPLSRLEMKATPVRCRVRCDRLVAVAISAAVEATVDVRTSTIEMPVYASASAIETGINPGAPAVELTVGAIAAAIESGRGDIAAVRRRAI